MASQILTQSSRVVLALAGSIALFPFLAGAQAPSPSSVPPTGTSPVSSSSFSSVSSSSSRSSPVTSSSSVSSQSSSSAAKKAEPIVRASIAQFQAGDRFSVSGEGFAPFESVDLMVNYERTASTIARAGGDVYFDAVYVPGNAAFLTLELLGRKSAADVRLTVPPAGQNGGPSSCLTAQVSRTHQTIRALWSRHVELSRQYVTAAMKSDVDAPLAQTLLYRNAQELGEALSIDSGAAAGREIASVLERDVEIGAGVLSAVQSGDSKLLTEATDRWYAHAWQIAETLRRVNSVWSGKTIENMLYARVSLGVRQITALRGNKEADAGTAHAESLAQAAQIADALAQRMTHCALAVPELPQAGIASSARRGMSRVRGASAISSSSVSGRAGFKKNRRSLRLPAGSSSSSSSVTSSTAR